MILFMLGLLLGVCIAGVAIHLYKERQLAVLRHDYAHLHARLRSLLSLAAGGFIRPETVEAANVLNDLQRSTDQNATSRPEAGRSHVDEPTEEIAIEAPQPQQSHDRMDDEVPRLFSR
jgi:hypothetical protein